MDVTHIDTCLGCYLQDHHNRPGELLLGVPVDGSTTYQEVLDALMDELTWRDADPSFDYGLAKVLAIREFETVSDMSKPFDSSLEVSTEEDDGMQEDCQAWFLITWDADADEAEAEEEG